MFIGAILVLRKLDLTSGKLDAAEVGPIAPATLEEEEPEEGGQSIVTVPDELTGKESPQ